ncbi:MAG: helix-turn-helix transcriptional regulator [Spirochaetales bacterium]|nr:helix-turn-helix transcriptional regulator [Spirochaetales bacterium]
MKKFFLFFLLFFPLPFLIPVILTFFEKSLIVYPNKKYINDFGFYADVNSGGNSEVLAHSVTPEQISFEYIIREGHSFLYAGMCVSFGPAPSLLLDVSHYDYMTIRLSSSFSRKCDVYLDVFQDNITDIKKEEPLRPIGRELVLKQGMNTYTIWLDSLITPYYWLREYNLPEKIDKDNNRFEKVKRFKINESQPEKIEKEIYNHLIVKTISFHKSHFLLYLITFSSIIFYYIILFFLLGKFRKNEGVIAQDPSLPGYKKLYLENYKEQDLDKIIGFIKSHYYNPDFSPLLVQKSTGISTARINQLIRRQFKTSLIQFVNHLRITEVKRLLVQTDRNITELAFKVGFNNISYFNKLFKKREGVSPREYRKIRNQEDTPL